jgi:hypothetical protein
LAARHQACILASSSGASGLFIIFVLFGFMSLLLFTRSDSTNCRSGGETPPELAGEDACATTASAKIFDLV